MMPDQAAGLEHPNSGKRLRVGRRLFAWVRHFRHNATSPRRHPPTLFTPTPAVPESIVTRAERANADFLVLGIAGLTKLGSVCEDILNQG